MIRKFLVNYPKVLLFIRHHIRREPFWINDSVNDVFFFILSSFGISLKTLFKKLKHDLSMSDIFGQRRFPDLICPCDKFIDFCFVVFGLQVLLLCALNENVPFIFYLLFALIQFLVQYSLKLLSCSTRRYAHYEFIDITAKNAITWGLMAYEIIDYPLFLGINVFQERLQIRSD